MRAIVSEPDRRLPEARRLSGNLMWLVVGDAVGKLVSFFFVVAVARGLTKPELGIFSFALSFVPLFLVFGEAGLDTNAFREIARAKERLPELFVSGLVIRVTLGFIGLLGSIAIAPVLVEGSEAFLAVILVGIALYLDELGSYVAVVFKAFEQMRLRATRLMINRLLTTGLVLAAILLGGDLVAVCAMYALGSLGSLFYAFVALRRHFPPVRLADSSRDTMRELMKKGAPLAIASILIAAAFRIDMVMLQAIKGAGAVAIYGIAYRFLDTFMFVAWGLANVTLPSMSRGEGERGGMRLFELSLAMSLAFYLPLAVGAPFAGRWVIELLFGSRYAAAATALSWVMAAGVAYALAYQGRLACAAIGKRNQIAWVAGIALVFTVVGNAFAIPRYGFEGAAVMTLLTSTLEAVAMLAVVIRGLGRIRVGGAITVPVLAAAVMGGVLWGAGVEDGLAMAVGAASYGVALPFFARLLAPEESRLALSLLRRRSKSPETG